MSKRGSREGTIFELPDGKGWRGAVSLGYENGKHVRKWVQRQTRGEVVGAIKELVRRKEANLPITSSKRTVAMYLADWLKDEVKPNRNVSTLRIYSGLVRLYIDPTLGRVRLSELTGQHVQQCLNQAAERLAPSSVRLLSTVLRTALKCGERWGVLAGNAAKHTSLPAQVKHDATPLTVEQANHLLGSVKDHRYGAVFVIALSLGLRRAEIAGLKWDNIDFIAGRLKVTHQLKRVTGQSVHLSMLKTKKSKRTLQMPRFVLDALLRRQLTQEGERIKAGDKWQEQGYIFTSYHGNPISPEKFNLIHAKALKRAELPHVRFHDLRHTAASLLLSKGVSMKLIQEVLGHSDFNITANIYAHVVEVMRDEATQAMEDLFASQKNPVVAPVVALVKSETIQ